MSMTSPPRPTLIRGFTLIEIVITIVILGAVAGILVPFFNAIVHSPDPVIRERAISLGQAMMDEIMAKRWDENTPIGGGPICTTESPDLVTRPKLIDACVTKASPDPAAPIPTSFGPDGTETRPDYNDVDDYNYYDNHPEIDTFTDQNGKPFALPSYSRKVSVRYIPSSSDPIIHDLIATGSLVNKTDTKLVVVTVTSPLGETFYFVAAACNI